MSSGERFDAALAAAQAGDESGMTALFRSLHPHLLRYLRAKDPAAAEDLASEVWIGVWSGIGSFRGDERAFRAWVFTIAARRLADHRRRAGRLRAEPGPGPLLTDAPAPDDPAALVTDGLTAQEAVRRMVAGLPPDQAEVLLLRVVADLDVAEVARIMGRTEVSVRVLQHRALKRLSDRYSRKVVTE